MRKQEEKLIVTFHTTAAAIAAERICREAELSGRIIPVPRELSAGCGLAWCAGPDQEQELRQLLAAGGLEWEAMTVLLY